MYAGHSTENEAYKALAGLLRRRVDPNLSKKGDIRFCGLPDAELKIDGHHH